jgi:hypothetical protein
VLPSLSLLHPISLLTFSPVLSGSPLHPSPSLSVLVTSRLPWWVSSVSTQEMLRTLMALDAFFSTTLDR